MYGGFNSPNAMRMLQSLYAAHQPAPEPAAAPVKASRPRKVRAPTPSVTSDESESESDTYSSASSDYEDTDVIYHHVTEKAKCPRVSPAGLKSHSGSRREAVAYLKKKECPEVPNLKKAKPAAPAKVTKKTAAKAEVKVEAPAAPTVTLAEPEKAVIPKTRRVSRKAKKVVAAEPVAAPAAPAPAPVAPAPAAPAGKAKRAPSAYNTFVAEQRKAGKTMAEAAAAWRAKKGQ